MKAICRSLIIEEKFSGLTDMTAHYALEAMWKMATRRERKSPQRSSFFHVLNKIHRKRQLERPPAIDFPQLRKTKMRCKLRQGAWGRYSKPSLPMSRANTIFHQSVRTSSKIKRTFSSCRSMDRASAYNFSVINIRMLWLHFVTKSLSIAVHARRSGKMHAAAFRDISQRGTCWAWRGTTVQTSFGFMFKAEVMISSIISRERTDHGYFLPLKISSVIFEA